MSPNKVARPTSEPLLYFNGVDGESGEYLLSPRRLDGFARLAERRELEPPVLPRRLKFGLDPLDLAEAGWGVIWPEDPDPEIREALGTLLEHRRGQASGEKELFKELTYLTGETTLDFWRRHGLGPDSVNPERMPYYLLIVGEPGAIPFDFQSELGIPYAVGRISFDSAEGYAAYARHLVDADRRALPDPRTIAFFAVENPDDEPTRWSVEHLVKPLEEKIARRRDWRVKTLLRRAADKAQLAQLLGGDSPPTVLFTASHAVRYHPDSPRQATHQGALLCADWPGLRAWKGRGPLPDGYLFAARDVASDVELDPLVAFHFACYTAGTPHLDPYSDEGPRVAAHRPFVASLPKRLLRCGALAVIGHVDVTLEQSFLWFDAGSQLEVFDGTLKAIMAGHPVGHAMNHFGDRFGLLGALVAGAVRSRSEGGDKEDVLRRFQLWAAYQDARNYVILGDPAARLNIGR